MTEKTNTTKTIEPIDKAQTVAFSNVSHDLRNAILIVSVVANLFIFTAWLMLQVTTQYDTQIANFLFNR